MATSQSIFPFFTATSPQIHGCCYPPAFPTAAYGSPPAYPCATTYLISSPPAATFHQPFPCGFSPNTLPASAYAPLPGVFPVPAYGPAAPTTPDREYRPSQHHASTPTSITRASSSTFPSVATYHYTPESVAPPTPEPATTGAPATPAMPATDSTSSQHSSIDFVLGPPPSSSPAAARVTTNAPADSIAVNADGLILTEMEFVLTELRGACGLRPRSSPATTGTTPVSATSPSEVPSVSSSTATAYAAPQMFGEMPQSYGFNNLVSQSVLLADGTKRRYYALPDDYPLEQANPPMSPSAAEKVGVTAAPTAAAQVAGLAPVLCSKANSSADSESLLVHVVQPPMSMQDAPDLFEEICDVNDEETGVYLSKNEMPFPPPPMSASASDQMQFQTLERMPVFDVYDDEVDGYSSDFVDVLADIRVQTCEEDQQESEQPTKCIGKARLSSERPTVAAFSDHAANFTFPHVPVIHAERSIMLTNEKSTQATSTLCVHEAIVHCPDERPEHICCTNGLETVQPKFEQEDILISGAVSNVVNSKAGEFLAPPSHCIKHPKQRLLWDPGEFPTLFTTAASATELQGTNVYKSELTRSCEIQKLLNSLGNLKKMILGPSWKLQLNTPLKLLMQSLCTNVAVQVTKQRHHLEFLVMDEMVQNVSEFTDGQPAYMPQDTSSGFSEWVRQGLTARIATRKPLSWLQISELATWQSQVTSASYVWDPGTMLLWYKFKWGLLYTEEKINWLKEIKCYEIALWLITFNPP